MLQKIDRLVKTEFAKFDHRDMDIQQYWNQMRHISKIETEDVVLREWITKKQNWMENRCKEKEDWRRMNGHFAIHRKIKEVIQKENTPTNTNIHNGWK